MKTKEILEDKIPVLVFGVFHFNPTSDANSISYEYRENEVDSVSVLISKFKPSIICIEYEPKYQDIIDSNFKKYLFGKTFSFKGRSEAEILSYKIGKLSKSRNIECIDHKLGYDYPKVINIAKKNNEQFYKKLEKTIAKFDEMLYGCSLIEKLLILNSEEYKTYMRNINADILLYTNSDKGFEGADVASEFYRRNLRIFANLNKISIKNSDRVLIIYGAGHVPFLEELVKNSPKYNLASINDYMK